MQETRYKGSKILKGSHLKLKLLSLYMIAFWAPESPFKLKKEERGKHQHVSTSSSISKQAWSRPGKVKRILNVWPLQKTPTVTWPLAISFVIEGSFWMQPSTFFTFSVSEYTHVYVLYILKYQEFRHWNQVIWPHLSNTCNDSSGISALE